MIGRNGTIRRAPGFADRARREFEQVDAAIRVARDVMYARGYQPIETPILEPTELFLRRSGGILSSQLFDFDAPDGCAVSLRPELTAPVVRHALEQREAPLPQRFQYASPIFRYAEPQTDSSSRAAHARRQFTQIGAELIGEPHPGADGEMIGMAHALAVNLGARNPHVRIGHVGIIRDVLGRFDLSERARLFLADRVGELATADDAGAAVEAEAVKSGLIARNGATDAATQATAASLLSRLAAGTIRLPTSSETTSRSAEDIIAGLRRKAAAASANRGFAPALAAINQLSKIRLSAEDAVTRRGDSPLAERIAAAGIGKSNSELPSQSTLGSVVAASLANGVPTDAMTVDLGTTASIAYYTGVVFELRVDTEHSSLLLGCGGRYDNLATALGADRKLPALGFALNLEKILELQGGDYPTAPRRRYSVLIPDGSNAADVARRAAAMRANGENVVALYDPMNDADALARQLGAATVVKVRPGKSGDDGA